MNSRALRSRRSSNGGAAYAALCDASTGVDAIALTSYFDLDIDIHHIFPRAYCEKTGLPRERWNSVVNKAPLSAKTNRVIGGHKPSTYLATLEKAHGVEPHRLDEILRTHLSSKADRQMKPSFTARSRVSSKETFVGVALKNHLVIVRGSPSSWRPSIAQFSWVGDITQVG